MLLTLLLAFSLQLESESVILINAESGVILYQKEPHKLLDPASTTKIATCLYALTKRPNLDQQVVGNQDCIGIISEKDRLKKGYAEPPWRLEKAACHMGIKSGEVLTLRDLFNGMMIASADDASNLIAETISGSIPKFMEEVNLYLKKIGCNETHLDNPHGLYYPTQKSTAYDLAQMTRVGLKNAYFCAFVRAKDFIRPKTNMQESAKYSQTNKLLRPGKYFYPFAIGVKTGWFTACGFNLVAAAEKDGRKLIAVLLGAPSAKARFEEAIALFESAFNEPATKVEVLKPGKQATPIDHPSGKKGLLTTFDPLYFYSYPSENESYQLTFEWVSDNSGKYSIIDGQGNRREEVYAHVEGWQEEKKSAASWAYLSFLLVPFSYFLWKKK